MKKFKSQVKTERFFSPQPLASSPCTHLTPWPPLLKERGNRGPGVKEVRYDCQLTTDV